MTRNDPSRTIAAPTGTTLVEFVAELPKTPSGKLQRFILRNQEIAKQHALLAASASA
mgnify:CR=1 FL=1